MRTIITTGTETPTVADAVSLIGRIATDRAAQIRALGRAAIVLAAIPEWAQAREIEAWFGMPRHRLVRLVAERKVTGRKFDADDPRSVAVFRVADVRRAVDELPDYADWLEKRTMEREEEREKGTAHEAVTK